MFKNIELKEGRGCKAAIWATQNGLQASVFADEYLKGPDLNVNIDIIEIINNFFQKKL